MYVIVGPTASGKTALAIQWAQALNCDIINFDSRQVYHELSIGVARPSEVELAAATHHLIASHSIHEPLNAARFSEQARKIARECIEKHGKVILVGGTGLYVKAFLEGLDELPKVDPNLREQINAWFEEDGIFGIGQRLYELDPNAFDYIEKENPARVKRALEICLTTGEPVASWRKNEGVPLPFSYGIWGIETVRSTLYERIEARVDEMLANGFEAEVSALMPYKDYPVMRTVGYHEFFDFFEGNVSRSEAISLMKQKTRNYAKRQITWFKNQTQAQWDTLEELIKLPKNI